MLGRGGRAYPCSHGRDTENNTGPWTGNQPIVDVHNYLKKILVVLTALTENTKQIII